MPRLHGSGTCKPASRGRPLLWACSQDNGRMEAQSGTRDGLMAQKLYHNMGGPEAWVASCREKAAVPLLRLAGLPTPSKTSSNLCLDRAF